MEGFTNKKPVNMEGKEKHQVEVSNRSAALRNFGDNVDINRAWESLREYKKLRQRESRFLRVNGT
jgi:hypothetical protein